jgi:hypothetical protein
MTEPEAPEAAEPSKAALAPSAEAAPTGAAPAEAAPAGAARLPPAGAAPPPLPNEALPHPAPEPAPSRPLNLEPPPAARDTLLPWLCGLGFLVLAGAIGFVWWSAQQPQSQPQPSADLQALQDRIARLEQRPAPGSPDLAPLTARVAALEQRPASDLAPLEARVAALEKQFGTAGRLDAQVDAQLGAISNRVDALAGRDQTAIGDLGRRLDTDEVRLTALEHTTAQMAAAAQQAARLARIQAAQAALAAGRPLGDLPDAPPAVAHFAAANPPTEASLRLAFPAAEQAALAASRPDLGDKPFLARVLAHAEDLVTVRQGDRVLVGDPAAGVLARAHTALAAGDLAATVEAVSTLSGPAATAMAGWLADAKALLAARAGLTDMAAHA